MNTPLSPIAATSIGAGLPIVNQALEPASVRNGSPARQQAYARALDFEGMLVQQLSQSLTAVGGLTEDGGEGAEGGAGTAIGGGLSSLMPEALSNGVMSQGGLGLATQLMEDLEPVGGAAAAGSRSSLAPDGGRPAGGSARVESAATVGATGGVSS